MARRRYALHRHFRIERLPDPRLPWQQGYGEHRPEPELRHAFDTLMEVTERELRDDKRQHGPRLSYLKPIDWRRAHDWVKSGGHHSTGLYTDIDGRIRYATGEF